MDVLGGWEKWGTGSPTGSEVCIRGWGSFLDRGEGVSGQHSAAKLRPFVSLPLQCSLVHFSGQSYCNEVCRPLPML